MLYDFYKYQNSLSGASQAIHATYLLYGVKSPVACHKNGDDGTSSSMPEPETRFEAKSTETLALMREEKLDGEWLGFFVAYLADCIDV